MIKLIKRLISSIFEKYNQFFFVGSSDVLPPPLEKDEEVELVIRAQKGELEARNKLIEHNLRLVVFIAKKYETKLDTLEDLVSIGSIGLIKGINTYKIDKNIRLATYASRCISNEILMYLRKNKKRTGDISFEEALSFDSEGNELHLEDILGTSEDVTYKEYEKITNIDTLQRTINDLEERDKQIMIMRYGLYNTKEFTQKEVASILGISQSYISRIEKKVIKRLKLYLE